MRPNAFSVFVTFGKPTSRPRPTVARFSDSRSARTSGTRRVYGGLYSDPAAAERGIRRFRDSGSEGERIGIISRDREEAKEVAENTGASAAAGAATGAVAGGLLGGLTGLLVGIGALAIPGIGPFYFTLTPIPRNTGKQLILPGSGRRAMNGV